MQYLGIDIKKNSNIQESLPSVRMKIKTCIQCIFKSRTSPYSYSSYLKSEAALDSCGAGTYSYNRLCLQISCIHVALEKAIMRIHCLMFTA